MLTEHILDKLHRAVGVSPANASTELHMTPLCKRVTGGPSMEHYVLRESLPLAGMVVHEL